MGRSSLLAHEEFIVLKKEKLSKVKRDKQFINFQRDVEYSGANEIRTFVK